jgi:hypothetical protein
MVTAAGWRAADVVLLRDAARVHGAEPEQLPADLFDLFFAPSDLAWRIHNRYYSADSGLCQAIPEAVS